MVKFAYSQKFQISFLHIFKFMSYFDGLNQFAQFKYYYFDLQ